MRFFFRILRVCGWVIQKGLIKEACIVFWRAARHGFKYEKTSL
jgi:hypothetical protein